MKAYIHDDFLLSTDLSKRLYHDHAEKMPIFDYHSHLNIKTIAENQCIPNLGKAWLDGDHYKWRAVRARTWGHTFDNSLRDLGPHLWVRDVVDKRDKVR